MEYNLATSNQLPTSFARVISAIDLRPLIKISVFGPPIDRRFSIDLDAIVETKDLRL